MAYYDNFLYMSKPPKEQIADQMQEFVTQRFEISSTFYDNIEIETAFGTLEFEPIEARINRQIDHKTGTKISEDYRKILFSDLSFKPDVGTRFRFDDNIWIIYSVNNLRSETSSAYIRRCNNTLNIQDKYGNIHQEPCYLEDNLLNKNPTEDEFLTTIKGNRTLYAQYNQWTKNINVGWRFIFGRTAYKVSNFADVKRMKTFQEDSVKIFAGYVDIDGVNEYDRFYDEAGKYIGVADYREYDYQIIIPDKISGVVGDVEQLSCSVTLNGVVVDEPTYWVSSDPEIVQINPNTGEYELMSLGSANIACVMENNNSVYSEIEVSVVETAIDIYENVLTPREEYIPLTTTQTYRIYETLNGKEIDTAFKVKCSNMNERYYGFEMVDDNTFSIKNIKENPDALLKVVCTNIRDNSTVELYVELGGLF